MATTVTKNFKLYNTKKFKNEVVNVANNNLYLFISRVTSWPSDSSPPTTADTMENTQYNVWQRMIAAKKILTTDVTFAAPRNDWVSGTVYAQYSSNSTYYSSPYYVVNSDYRIYKCLGNNGGGTSTIMPTGESVDAFQTGDSYIWKYMYSIGASDILKFITTGYIPVKTLTTDDGSAQWDVQVAANNASIETFVINSGGSGYRYHTGTAQSGTSSTITLATGANATNGFYNGMSVYILSGTGAGQVRTISNYTGSTKIASVSVNWSINPDGTSVYVVSPRVVVTGDGTGFSAYTTVTTGAISAINVLNPGQNYTTATVSFVSNTAVAASVRPNLSPPGGHGSDAVGELFASNLVFDVKLTGSESNTFMTQNDYRVVGLMLNPKLSSNGAVATASTYDQCVKMTVGSPVSTFLKDEVITGVTSGATATVVEYFSGSVIRLISKSGTFSGGETVTGGTSGATATVSSVVNSPLKAGSGTVLFIENRSPISRSSDQIENFKIVVKF